MRDHSAHQTGDRPTPHTVTEQFEGLLVAGGGGRVIPGELLHEAKVVDSGGFAEPVASLARCRQCTLRAADWSQ